jgi:aryl-alcohol dehydrogenase-like predicted oxidoreductase
MTPGRSRANLVRATGRRTDVQRTQLATMELGTTGLDITRVGLGAWAIGGGGWEFGWGPQEDEESLEAIHHALDTPGVVAVAWTLRHPAVDGAIVGFRRPSQVDPVLVAANLELDDTDIAEIEGRG